MTSIRLTEEQRSERAAFLRRRQLGIGGSDMPAILGLSKYANALDVYYSKTRPIREEDIEDQTIHQLRGHAFEPMAMAHYWQKTGRRGRAASGPSKHPDYPNVVASLDFDIFADDSRPDGFKGTAVGEIKSPVASVFRRVYEHGLRDSEIVQLQTNIAVSRRSWGSLAYFNMEDSNGPILAVDQVADTEMGAFLLATGQRFWDEHVAPRVPPHPQDWHLFAAKDAPVIIETSGELEIMECDDSFARSVSVLLGAKDLVQQAKDDYTARNGAVLAALLEHGIGKAQIPGIARLTVVTKQGRVSFDAKTLAKAMPLDRDAVSRLLHAAIPKQDENDIERTLTECELDLSLFEKRGSPSQYLLAKRSADI